MSNDKFGKFFADHRDEFDDKSPSAKVWSRIERALFGSKEVKLWNSLVLWRAAAALLLMLSLVQFLGPRFSSKAKEELASQQEFRDVESYYQAQIVEKASLIRNDAFAEEQFTQDFEKLEAMYAVLAEELKKSPSTKVKDALVLNMLVRIDLLNQLIQKQEESKKKPSEV